MSAAGPRIAICGAGAVSPAGWSLGALHGALRTGEALPAATIEGPGSHSAPLPARLVPKPEQKLPFLRNPRLRRASPVGRFLAAACVEAVGDGRMRAFAEGEAGRLAVIVSSYCGCVNYSKRFYREVLADPGTASPIVFPETVFNAPASHLSALFASTEVNYTLVGDQSQFLNALELGARWLSDGLADSVLVAAAEETDSLTAGALALFERGAVVGEGAAALLLERDASPAIELEQVTDLYPIHAGQTRDAALRQVRAALAGSEGALFESGRAEPAWDGHPQARFALGEIFGEGFGVAAGWACAAAYAELATGGRPRALISAAGANQACGGAVFVSKA